MIEKSLNLEDGARVFAEIYSEHKVNKRKYIDIIKESISTKESYNECVKCNMTDWNLFENPQFEDLNKWIEKVVNECARSMYRYTDDFKIKESWGLIYKKNDFAKSHTHFPYTFSFAYFLSTHQNHPPLVFDKVYPELIQIKPTEGTLVIFPSYVHHFVPSNTEDCERIVISGNLN